MKILVTGANGFVGKNLCLALKNIKDGKDRTRGNLKIEEVFEYDLDSKLSDLDCFCEKADFVFNLAGVNRPEDTDEFMKGNFGFASDLLSKLKRHRNKAPVMLASSVQATCMGRYDNDYGKSKRAGEELFFQYASETGVKVLVYRFPNLFGKWCRPNYNSAVATFCYNIANDLPIKINNPETELELLYIDDLVAEMLNALEGKEQHCEFEGINFRLEENGRFCAVLPTYRKSLKEIAELLYKFKNQPLDLVVPDIPENSFEKKLYSAYLSYLPSGKAAVSLKTNVDCRGSFTELIKTEKCGQFSVNIIKPGITKGEHWHNSKWEIFIVVSGHGLIRQRKIGSDEIIEFEVSGDDITAVYILPGYTHSIKNRSETENLVALMWANECFDPENPDTFYEKV